MKTWKIVTLLVVMALIAVFIYAKYTENNSNVEYQRCADAGGATQESNPPTCAWPDGRGSITPGFFQSTN